MSNATDASAPSRRSALSPATIKLVWLAGLVVAMFIPNYMTSNLIGEREDNERTAQQAVTRTWGPPQSLVGPMLMVTTKGTGDDQNRATTYARFPPKSLDAEIELVPERRRRGFFQTTVYAATIHLKGTFTVPDTMATSDGGTQAMPESGFVAIMLRDVAGVSGADTVSLDGVAASWRRLPDHKTCQRNGALLVIPIGLRNRAASRSFEATLHLRGTKNFQIAAIAKAMNATIKGAWSSPSFIGDEPPVKTAAWKDGFAAQWHIDEIGEPGVTTSACAVDASNVGTWLGVDLVEPVPVYRMVTRAAKYAPLFIVLAFTAYFVFELASGLAITIVQYALMGASLSLFALLLVSFSEVTGFTSGYVAAAALVTAQASIYTALVTRRLRPALAFVALLSGLFGFLYVLLGLETLALLTGAIALFVLLSVVMALTERFRRTEGETVAPKGDATLSIGGRS